jgi:anti-sigma factor RsiW
MNCKQIESRLIDYLDGNLGAPERERMELHARSCALCAERIQGFSEVFGVLDEWKGIEPSASFNRRLEERLEAESARAPFWGYFFGRLVPLPAGNPVFALALLAVVSLAALVVGYSPSEPRNLAAQPAQSYASASLAGVDDFTLIQDLPVLEDLDVLRNFDVLQELNPTPSAEK